MPSRTLKKLAAATVLMALLGAACSSDSKNNSATGSGGSTASEGSGKIDASWAVQYVGATDSPADSSLKPVTIGWVNNEGAVGGFPEYTQAIEAGVKFVNERLNGVNGHPVQLAKCIVQSEEDGQRCATEMANNADVTMIMTGGMIQGAGPFHQTIGDKKLVLMESPSTTPELTSTSAIGFGPGAAALLQGIALFVGKNLQNVKKVAVVFSDNAAGRLAAENLFAPTIKGLGITNIGMVAMPEAATGPDAAAAIQAAGAQDADVIVPLASTPGCIAVYDALQSLSLKATVVTSTVCAGPAVVEHVGSYPEDWIFAGGPYSTYISDKQSGIDQAVDLMKTYTGKDIRKDGAQGVSAAMDLITLVKIFNTVGADKLTVDSVRTAVRAFPGPVMGGDGQLHCGWNPIFKAICGSTVGFERFKGGTWEAVADATNGKAVDVRDALPKQ